MYVHVHDCMYIQYYVHVHDCMYIQYYVHLHVHTILCTWLHVSIHVSTDLISVNYGLCKIKPEQQFSVNTIIGYTCYTPVHIILL